LFSDSDHRDGSIGSVISGGNSDDLNVAESNIDRKLVFVEQKPNTVIIKKDFECFFLHSNIPYQTITVLI
ncbi:MAG: hypothetical protein EZS28_036727, partial [Streblomastix strix]